MVPSATPWRSLDYVKLLSAGINVGPRAPPVWPNPHAYEPAEWRTSSSPPKAGQVSLYASGTNRGSPPTLPLVLTRTQSSQIEKIHSYEIGLHDDYGVPDIMSDALGFGRTRSTTSRGSAAPGRHAGEWQGSSGLIADALGVEIQEVRADVRSRAPTRPRKSASGHRWKPGPAGAAADAAIGAAVDGRARGHHHRTSNRLAPDVAPDWPTLRMPAIGLLARVITGTPDIDLHSRCDATRSRQGRASKA